MVAQSQTSEGGEERRREQRSSRTVSSATQTQTTMTEAEVAAEATPEAKGEDATPTQASEEAPSCALAPEAVRSFYELDVSDASPSAPADHIAEALGCSATVAHDARQAATVSLLEQALSFSRKCGLSVEQASAFAALCTACIDAIGRGSSLKETEAAAKANLAGLAAPDGGKGAAASEHVLRLTLEFLARTIFQHHALYATLFTGEREQDRIEITLEVETVAHVPPLSSGELEGVAAEEDAGAAAATDETDGGADATEGGDEGDAPADGAGADADEEEAAEVDPVSEIIEEEITRRMAEFQEKLKLEYEEREKRLLERLEGLKAS